MEPNKPGHDRDRDLSEKWIFHQRKATRTTFAMFCPLCKDRRALPTENIFWSHILEAHSDKVPQDDDTAVEKFKETLRLQALGAIIPRPSRDDSSTKPHEDLTAVEAEEPPPIGVQGSRSRPSFISPPLTVGKLRDFQRSQVKRQDGSTLTHPDTLTTSNKSFKKRALGHGKSPSSSIQTAHSNDSQRQTVETVSQQRLSPRLLREKTRDLEESEITRPPIIRGKRLFQPDSDSPFTAPNPASPTNTRPRSSHQQHKKNQKSTGQIYTSRPLSTVEPGTIPISVLNAHPSNARDAPSQNLEAPRIVRQPETRPISQEQLVAEVKGIYAGLVMVEGKCIQVDSKQAALARDAPQGSQPKLNNEQWQALIALHRTLLHEHHDFFLASQHPSATPAVRRLAIKYAMPARLWRHGIHSFLELLRNRLPDSLDHMLAFIYLAYSMMTLLYETVPAFEETWIECLGDLGRYRMAIEDDDIRDREVWTQVARQWYLKASDRSPETGRLYHHLAILARPNALQQLFFYSKALSVPQPFIAAGDSILTLFEPVLNGKQTRRFPPVITAYIMVNAILFMRNNSESFNVTLAEYVGLLDSYIARVTQKYLEQGYYMGISNCLALLSFGSLENPLFKALSVSSDAGSADINITGAASIEVVSNPLMFKEARQLFVQTAEVNLQRVGDPNILSFLHVILVFMVHISRSALAMKLLEGEFPWHSLVVLLNTLLRFYHTYVRIEGDEIPVPEENDFRPAPEEFAMRGLFWTVGYFLPGWFLNKNIEDENQYKEDASMNTDYRPERILWLGCRLAKSGKWIIYSKADHKFSLPDFGQAADGFMTPTGSSEPEPDSGTESATDSATITADCDVDVDAEVEEMSFASRTSTGLSEKTQGQESRWGVRTASTWDSQETRLDDGMEMEEGSV